MSTFILIHGAWHGSWCWKHLVPYLEQAGHTVYAPDLPGHGKNRMSWKQINEQSYAQTILDLMDTQDEKVILLGHSLGGWTISRVAEQRPHQVERLVYLAALLPQDQESYLDLSASDTESTLFPQIDFSDTTATLTKNADLAALFYADCPPEDIAWARAHLVPEPLTGLAPTLDLTPDRFDTVPKIYITCTQDKALGPQLQKRMYTMQPCQQVFTLNSSHSPFFSMPGQLAAILLSLTERRGAPTQGTAQEALFLR